MFAGLDLGLPTASVERLAQLLSMVEDELVAQTRSTVFTVQEVGTVTLQAGGKRLRPALVVLAALSTGLPVEELRLARLGACLEMIHMATLVHDDVIDESPTRRGKPTAASLHGNTAAILSGDVLLARAMRLLALDGDLRIIRTVSEAVVELAEGEVMELEARGNFDLTEEQHLEILRKKTASLISCCSRVGAMSVRAPQTIEDSLARYGQDLGLAFQITDDLLDFAGDPNRTGKPIGTDYRDGQATLPLIDLSACLGPRRLADVRSRFGNGASDSDIAEICREMGAHGSVTRVRGLARERAQSALGSLADLPSSDYTDLLGSITRFVAEREA